MWDAATGKQIGAPLAGHARAVNRAAFSPDGERIVTASEDRTARLWDAATGKQIGGPLVGHEGDVASAAFSPDGKRIVTASWDTDRAAVGGLCHHPAIGSAAKAVIPRCLTAEQRTTPPAPEPPTWCVGMDKWPYQTEEWKHWLADTRAGKNPPLPRQQ